MIDEKNKLSIRHQCELLSINRSSYYYTPQGESEENLRIMRLMDEFSIEEPSAGVLTMQDMLLDQGIKAGHERVRRLMRLANIKAIYPRKNLTKIAKGEYVHPYLLRGLEISHPNHVWEIDITYIPMANGFMYLTAIIDVYSRFIVGWDVSNSLDTEASLKVVRGAVEQRGVPEILNSDQGCQFTSEDYTSYLQKLRIKISMDGKGRALDNIYIERFWRTIKYQNIYLHAYEDGLDLYKGIKKWLERYHNRRHQGSGEKPTISYNALSTKVTVV